MVFSMFMVQKPIEEKLDVFFNLFFYVWLGSAAVSIFPRRCPRCVLRLERDCRAETERNTESEKQTCAICPIFICQT